VNKTLLHKIWPPELYMAVPKERGSDYSISGARSQVHFGQHMLPLAAHHEHERQLQ